MKIAAIVTAVALATGSAAFAAEHSYSQDRDMSRDRPAVTDTHHDRAAARDANRSHEGVMAKTKRFFHGIGDKMRGAGSKMARATHTPDPNARREGDTRAMGAAGDTHDSARQRRMDDAYSNYERKQHHEEKR